MKGTTDAALRQLSALDPARRLTALENEGDVDRRIARIIASPHPPPIAVGPGLRVHRLRVGVGAAVVSFAMAMVAVVAWASPAQGELASGRPAIVARATIAAPSPSPRLAVNLQGEASRAPASTGG